MRTRRTLVVIWFFLLALTPTWAFSQRGYADSVKEIKSELKNYLSQLETIEKNLVTYSDYELYSSTYRDCVERMDVYYETNKSFITLESQLLFDIWSEIKDLREDIDEKIETLRQEAQAEALTRELETDFSLTALKYDQFAATFQQLPQMKRKAAKDTLVALKNRDMDLYPVFATQKIQHKDIIASNPLLDSLCKRIDSGHKTISEAQNIETVKWGDIIFKVTIVAALLAFLINLIVSKKQLNKQLNGKKKKKYTPSI